MTNYTDLIERLEKAPEPSRELGNEVLLACGWWVEERGNPESPYLIWFHPDDGDDVLDGDHPNPTASIDAALTLVPPMCDWLISGPDPDPMSSGLCFGYVRQFTAFDKREGRQDAEGVGRHKTAAIALCIAALKARAAMAGETKKHGV